MKSDLGYTTDYSKLKLKPSKDPLILTLEFMTFLFVISLCREKHISTKETRDASCLLKEALSLRQKWKMKFDKIKEKDLTNENLFDLTNILPDSHEVDLILFLMKIIIYF